MKREKKTVPDSLASVPVLQSLPGAVSAPEPRPLGQDELQLGRGPARDQGPDQRQGVLVKICLETKSGVRQHTMTHLLTHCGHQGVEDADSEGCAAGEGLSEVELSVRVIVIILVQELDITVIAKHRDHGHSRAIDGANHSRLACSVTEVTQDITGVTCDIKDRSI